MLSSEYYDKSLKAFLNSLAYPKYKTSHQNGIGRSKASVLLSKADFGRI